MKQLSALALTFTLLNLAACGDHPTNTNHPMTQTTTDARLKDSSAGGAAQNPKTASGPCGALSPISAGAKSIALADVVDGEKGTYRLSHVDLYSETDFQDTQKSISFRLSLAGESKGDGKSHLKSKLECKDLSQLPDSNSEGALNVPSRIAETNGAFESSVKLSYHIFGDQTQIADKVTVSDATDRADQKLETFVKQLGHYGNSQLYVMEDNQIALVSTQLVPSGNLSYKSETRYYFKLEKK